MADMLQARMHLSLISNIIAANATIAEADNADVRGYTGIYLI